MFGNTSGAHKATRTKSVYNPNATPEDTKLKTAAAYNAAADTYDHASNSFWSRFGQRTVDRIALTQGARVLDVCCGSGASAIPAAEAVGERGFVLGVDLAQNLLDLATAKAKQKGLSNIEFRREDLLQLNLEHESFNAVICGFGIFFIPEMDVAMRWLWRLVKPHGKLAITIWGPKFFEPANTMFWNSIQTVRPDLYKAFHPWDRISDPETLKSLFVRAGILNCEVVAEEGTHLVNKPEDWWSMVLGTGYRGTVELLNDVDYEAVRGLNLDFIRNEDVRAVEANVLYAVAEKGEPHGEQR